MNLEMCFSQYFTIPKSGLGSESISPKLPWNFKWDVCSHTWNVLPNILHRVYLKPRLKSVALPIWAFIHNAALNVSITCLCGLSVAPCGLTFLFKWNKCEKMDRHIFLLFWLSTMSYTEDGLIISTEPTVLIQVMQASRKFCHSCLWSFVIPVYIHKNVKDAAVQVSIAS